MLNLWINHYATPLTTGLFLVSLISGVAIFFHVGEFAFHGMHEWLSMVLLIPFVLHIKKNWTPLTMYLKRGWLIWPLGLSLVAALAFAAPALTSSGSSGGNPMVGASRVMLAASISDLAPLFKATPDALVTKLKSAGYTVAAPTDTLDAIAKASAKDSRAALAALMAR
jgi:hypothetical protein